MSCSLEVPTTEPDILYNKTNWRWDITLADFSASDYTLEYLLAQQAESSNKITLTATANGDVFEIDLDAAATETNLEPSQIDNYSWQAYLILKTDTDDRTFYAKGVFDIKQRADLETDPRSHNEIMRDAIEAFIQGKANIQDKKKSINDRAIELYSLEELWVWQNHFQNLIDAEAIEDDNCKGQIKTLPKIKSRYLGIRAQ